MDQEESFVSWNLNSWSGGSPCSLKGFFGITHRCVFALPPKNPAKRKQQEAAHCSVGLDFLWGFTFPHSGWSQSAPEHKAQKPGVGGMAGEPSRRGRGLFSLHCSVSLLQQVKAHLASSIFHQNFQHWDTCLWALLCLPDIYLWEGAASLTATRVLCLCSACVSHQETPDSPTHAGNEAVHYIPFSVPGF